MLTHHQGLNVQRLVAALDDQQLVAMILSEASDETRPTALDAGRLANRICDAAGIGPEHARRALGYQVALARLPGLVDQIPHARYVAGLT